MAGKTPILAEASDERVKLAVATTKLECAEKIVQMYQSMLHQAQGACGTPSSCQTPGSGSSSVPTPVGNPFLNFFQVG